jgi:hypothetical protein
MQREYASIREACDSEVVDSSALGLLDGEVGCALVVSSCAT